MGRRVEREGSGPGPKKTVSRPVLLDTSFLVALERETASGDKGPVRRFLPSLRGRQLVVSTVTVEELLEGAADESMAMSALQRFSIQGLHLAQARRCARRPNPLTPTLWEPIARRSSDLVPVTCAFNGRRFRCMRTEVMRDL
jgi:hypothetical protein